MNETVARRSYRAMGSDVNLIAVGVDNVVADRCAIKAAEFANTWEDLFSRFRAHSELSQLNRAGHRGMTVSIEFLGVLELAVSAWHRTEGRFDPSILPDLAALGYDRDFAELEASPGPRTPATRGTTGLGKLSIDRRTRFVRLPPGCQLDFGGIAKGVFVDRLARKFAGWPGGCVEAGGDLRVWGRPPDGDHWVVGVEDPFERDRDRCRIVIFDPDASAVATSAFNRKTWIAAGRRYHHLIDPATGLPAAGRLISATAIASDLATAEVATKALLVASSRGESLDPIDASTALVFDAGNTALQIAGNHTNACQIFEVGSTAISA